MRTSVGHREKRRQGRGARRARQSVARQEAARRACPSPVRCGGAGYVGACRAHLLASSALHRRCCWASEPDLRASLRLCLCFSPPVRPCKPGALSEPSPEACERRPRACTLAQGARSSRLARCALSPLPAALCSSALAPVRAAACHLDAHENKLVGHCALCPAPRSPSLARPPAARGAQRAALRQGGKGECVGALRRAPGRAALPGEAPFARLLRGGGTRLRRRARARAASQPEAPARGVTRQQVIRRHHILSPRAHPDHSPLLARCSRRVCRRV